MFPLTHIVLLCSFAFYADMSQSTYTTLLLYLSLMLILCNTRYLAVFKPYLESLHQPETNLSLAFILKNIAFLHEHIPFETVQAAPVSKLPLHNKKISVLLFLLFKSRTYLPVSPFHTDNVSSLVGTLMTSTQIQALATLLMQQSSPSPPVPLCPMFQYQ